MHNIEAGQPVALDNEANKSFSYTYDELSLPLLRETPEGRRQRQNVLRLSLVDVDDDG